MALSSLLPLATHTPNALLPSLSCSAKGKEQDPGSLTHINRGKRSAVVTRDELLNAISQMHI